MNVILLLVVIAVPVLVFWLADRIAAVMAWFDFTFNRWIWGKNDPFGGREGRRVFFRWGLRLWALGRTAFVAWALYASRG